MPGKSGKRSECVYKKGKMKMKKMFAMLLVLAMVFSLSACGGEETPVVETTAAAQQNASGDKMTVVLLMAKSTSPYSGAYFQEFKDNATIYPDIEWVAFDAQSDMTLQSQQADEAIAMNPDVICMQPVDSVAGVAVAKKVFEAGITFVNVNTSITEDGREYCACFYGPDFITQGALLADTAHESMPDGGNFVYLGQDSNNECSRLRLKGFMDRSEEKGYNFNLLAESPACNWQTESGKNFMSAFLSEYPGEIDLVYAVDDAVGYGAYQAINEDVSGLNDDIKLVSVGGCEANLQAIKEDPRYLATCWLSPTLEIDGAMELIVEILKGNMPAEYDNNMPIYAVTSENVDEFEPAY